MNRDPRRTEIGRSRGALIALALIVATVPSAWALEFEPQVAIVTHVIDGDSVVLRFPDAPGDARIEYRADLNATYIEQGWGWVPRAYPADRKQKYLELEREARAAKRGLWGMPCAPEP